jgi:cytochrome P450
LRSDLLGMMLSLGGDSEGDRGLTDDDILSQSLTFFFAGHETTAIALSWCLFYIATTPDVEKAVLAETDTVLADRPALAYDDMGRLPYISATVRETLRIAPPVVAFSRVVTADIRLAGKAIPAGTMVSVIPGALHLNDKYWPDCMRFDPSRFLHDDSTRHAFAWLPFSMRERNCIGMNFALLELRTAIATLQRRFVFRADPQWRPVMASVITSGPKTMRLLVRERVRAAAAAPSG